MNTFGRLFRVVYRFTHAFTLDGVKFYTAASRRAKEFFRRAGALALAIGTSVYAQYRKSLTPRIIAHELEHVRQAREHGILFPWKYWRELHRVGYHRNRFEQEARRAERRPRHASP